MKKAFNTNFFKNSLKRFTYKRILKYQNFILIVSSKNFNKKQEQVCISTFKSEGFFCLRVKTKIIRSLPFFSKISKSLTGELFFIYSKENHLDILNLKALSEISKTYNILYCIYDNMLFSLTKTQPLLQKSKGFKTLTLLDIFQQISTAFIGPFFPIVATIDNYATKKTL